ncbi:hypothetical protein IC575_002627 [Cucumis melo]
MFRCDEAHNSDFSCILEGLSKWNLWQATAQATGIHPKGNHTHIVKRQPQKNILQVHRCRLPREILQHCFQPRVHKLHQRLYRHLSKPCRVKLNARHLPLSLPCLVVSPEYSITK